MYPWTGSEARLVAGVMSGTSADGLDVALVKISGRGNEMEPELLAHETLDYSPQVRDFIRRCQDGERAKLEEILRLDVYLAEISAMAIKELVKKAGVEINDLEAVGFHGQTLNHQPEPTAITGVQVRGSLQVGNGSVLAQRLGCAVVNDLRSRDMALGGQGAPLTCYPDYIMYHARNRGRLVLNLGGIANITALPWESGLDGVMGFDTGPGNVLIDLAVKTLTDGEKRFDENGERALRGTVHPEALAKLMEHPYLELPPPKSLERATFGEGLFSEWRGQFPELDGDDLVATVTQFTAQSVAFNIFRHLEKGKAYEEVVVNGGGAKNPAIIKSLEEALPNLVISTGEDYFIPSAAREAVAFAILAHATMCGEPGNLPRVTGASKKAVLGSITFP